jgi:inositol oxygenase
MSTHITPPIATHLMEAWEADVKSRYNPDKKKDEFRTYDDGTPARVREFYRLNHTHQTREFVLAKKKQYGALSQRRMTIWQAMEFLNTLVDDSDPDTDLSQIDHNLQAAEAARKDGHPRWMIFTAFVHDLGKILCLYGEPQWAVVGDTFPVGCRWSDKVVFPEFFAANADAGNTAYQTLHGVYEPGCGIDQVDLSWGHDEYLSMVLRPYLPDEALAMIRYHSFYAWHREGAYGHLMNAKDERMLPWVRKFNPYDLYSKADEKPDFAKLKPYYDELINEFVPGEIRW